MNGALLFFQSRSLCALSPQTSILTYWQTNKLYNLVRVDNFTVDNAVVLLANADGSFYSSEEFTIGSKVCKMHSTMYTYQTMPFHALYTH